ncbi:hypothetical protein QCA50_009953 [Cerrena zonata]|uniref:Uncharacterized protein n=1 Tax=Cerrena zonata TaxID=2478898 RepID=A0AAW0GAB7_9APHY
MSSIPGLDDFENNNPFAEPTVQAESPQQNTTIQESEHAQEEDTITQPSAQPQPHIHNKKPIAKLFKSTKNN